MSRALEVEEEADDASVGEAGEEAAEADVDEEVLIGRLVTPSGLLPSSAFMSTSWPRLTEDKGEEEEETGALESSSKSFVFTPKVSRNACASFFLKERLFRIERMMLGFFSFFPPPKEEGISPDFSLEAAASC